MTTPTGDPPREHSSSDAPVREGRLLPEHAALYPGIPAGVWMPAATLAKHLLQGMVAPGGTEPRINARLLDDAHFEFRGGAPQSRAVRNSRSTDLR